MIPTATGNSGKNQTLNLLDIQAIVIREGDSVLPAAGQSLRNVEVYGLLDEFHPVPQAGRPRHNIKDHLRLVTITLRLTDKRGMFLALLIIHLPLGRHLFPGSLSLDSLHGKVFHVLCRDLDEWQASRCLALDRACSKGFGSRAEVSVRELSQLVPVHHSVAEF